MLIVNRTPSCSVLKTFCEPDGVVSGSKLGFFMFFYFFDELLECYVTDMDGLCIYSEEVNKASDSLGREEDCILDFTTNKVK